MTIIANEKNLKLNADCVRYKFQNSKLSAQIKSLQEKIKVLENRNQKLSSDNIVLLNEKNAFKQELNKQKLETNETIKKHEVLNQDYIKTSSKLEEILKVQEEEKIKYTKISTLFANLDAFLDDLEKKMAPPKCRGCINRVEYICLSHDSHYNLCVLHHRAHLKDSHNVKPMFETNFDEPGLDAKLNAYAKKIQDNKQVVSIFIVNTMKEIENLNRTITERLDGLFKEIIAMKTTGKPSDFDLRSIDVFDEMVEKNFLIDWFIDYLRKILVATTQ